MSPSGTVGYRPVLVKTVTLRLPEASYRTLMERCEQYGVTMRGIYEATTLISIRDLEDPDRREWTLLLWDAARVLDDSDFLHQPPRVRVNARLDDDIAVMLAKTCAKFGVTQNAALALVTSPWPIPQPPGYREFRHENWERITELARKREFARRVRRPYALT